MSSFIACYLIAWIAVTCYVAHLGAAQSSLRQKVDDLNQRIQTQDAEASSRSRAA